VLSLIKVKCMPMLLYCLAVCELSKSTVTSLDFCVSRFEFHICITGDCNIVREYFARMGFLLPSELLPLRTHKCLLKLQSSDNLYCHYTLLL
jgi:hypothetical protein